MQFSYILFLFSLDFPLRDLTHQAYWVTSWGFHMPWVGMDTKGCPYLENNCTAETVSDLQKFSYPIHVMNHYPAVSQVDLFNMYLFTYTV